MRALRGVVVVVTGAWLVGCGALAPAGDGGQDDAGASDAGHDAGLDAGSDAGAPRCDAGARLLTPFITEGGRLRVEVRGELHAAQFPDNFRWWPVDGGLEARAAWGSTGHLHAGVRYACNDGEAATELHLAIAPVAWKKLAEWGPDAGPSMREHALLWIPDTAPDTLWLQGGYRPGNYAILKDRWSFDLADGGWTRRETFDAGPEATGGRLAPAGVPGEALYFAGAYANDDYRYSLWRWREAEGFSPVPTADEAHAPFGSLGAFARDVAHDRWVTFGGYDGTTMHFDVQGLTLDDAGVAHWAKLSPDGAGPTGRYGFSWAVDDETRSLLVASGGQWPTQSDPVNPATDAWALELGVSPPRWRQLTGGLPTQGWRNGCQALDPQGHRLFVFGGTPDQATSVPELRVLELDPGAERWWTVALPDGPTPRSSCTAVWDAKRHRLVLGFGNDLSGAYTDLWALEL